MWELQVIILTGLDFQGNLRFMQKTYGIYSKNYIVEVDQHFPNTLKPIYHVFSTISSNNYVNLIWLMTHQSLFNSIGNNLLFILSIQTSLAIFCLQTALVDLISGHYQCSSDRGESVLWSFLALHSRQLSQSKRTDFSSFRIFKKVLRNPFLLGYYVSTV